MVGPHLQTADELIAGRFLSDDDAPVLTDNLIELGRKNGAKYLVVFFEAGDVWLDAYTPDNVFFVMPGESVDWVEERLAHAGHTSTFEITG